MADDTNVEIAVEVSGEKEAEKKLKDLAEAQDEATAATERNTDAAEENAQANQQSSQSAAQLAESMNGVQSSAKGANQFLGALSAAMKGDLVGAAKMAGEAIKSLGMAFATHPVLACIAVIAAAAAGLAKMFVETRHALEELYTVASSGQSAAIGRILERKKLDFGAMGDERLDNVISSLENARDRQRSKVNEAEDEASAIQSAPAENLSFWQTRKRKARIEDLNDSAARHYEQEKQFQAQLDAAIAERDRRKKAEEKSQSDAKTQGQSLADSEIALRHKQERYEAYDKAEAEKPGSGRLAALEKELFQVKAMHSIAEEGTQKEIDLRDKILELERSITEEKNRQKETEEQESAIRERAAQAAQQAQSDWERSRKLDKMDAGDRAAYIDNEIAQLRQGPRNADTEAKMRRLIDERDRAQDAADKDAARKKQDADELAHKRSDFLHRNDTDAQKLARIGKELGATDDQSKMLELMMAGEDVAESYQEPMTKRQQRRAEKKAARDEKAAMKEARKFRKQVADIEAKWKAGDESAQEAMAQMAAGGNKSAIEKIATSASKGNKSAQELAAKLTSDKNGVPSAIQSKGGKLVEVKGQDRTNQLLETIAKALT